PATTEGVRVEAGGQLGHAAREARGQTAAGAGAGAGRAALGALALVLRALRGLAAAAGQAHHAAHLLHHLLGLGEAFERLVDVQALDARAVRDAHAAGAVDDFRVGALLRGHRADDRGDPVEVAVVEVVELALELAHAGHHAEDVGDRAHLADGDQL